MIILKPKNVEIPEEVLWNAWSSNPDGGGIAWPEEDKVMIRKGYMTFKKLWDAVAHLPKELPAIVHCRIATHGGVSAGHCHPFPLSETMRKQALFACRTSAPIAVAHNGIISGFGETMSYGYHGWQRYGVVTTAQAKNDGELMSDTQEYIYEVLRPVANLMTPKLVKSFGKLVGGKFAFLFADGTLATSGEWDYDKSTKLYYSNSSPRKAKVYGTRSKSVYTYNSSTNTSATRALPATANAIVASMEVLDEPDIPLEPGKIILPERTDIGTLQHVNTKSGRYVCVAAMIGGKLKVYASKNKLGETDLKWISSFAATYNSQVVDAVGAVLDVSAAVADSRGIIVDVGEALGVDESVFIRVNRMFVAADGKPCVVLSEEDYDDLVDSTLGLDKATDAETIDLTSYEVIDVPAIGKGADLQMNHPAADCEELDTMLLEDEVAVLAEVISGSIINYACSQGLTTNVRTDKLHPEAPVVSLQDIKDIAIAIPVEGVRDNYYGYPLVAQVSRVIDDDQEQVRILSVDRVFIDIHGDLYILTITDPFVDKVEEEPLVPCKYYEIKKVTVVETNATANFEPYEIPVDEVKGNVVYVEKTFRDAEGQLCAQVDPTDTDLIPTVFEVDEVYADEDGAKFILLTNDDYLGLMRTPNVSTYAPGYDEWPPETDIPGYDEDYVTYPYVGKHGSA